ncbi:MAG: histidine kinase [Burkholderiales bacterium]|jgi:two-component system sensor histidine kinase AlgZ|nr:histidine kinase [Burkholderiales bacterium]
MIISQKESSLVLPGWRNVGTMMRIILGVNLGMFLVVLARGTSRHDWVDQTFELAAYVEPYLVLELAVFWLLATWIPKLTTSLVITVVTVVTILCGAFTSWLIDGVFSERTLWMIFWGLIAQVIMLYYFHMRNKMLSPVVTEAKLQALQARIRPHFLFNSINAVISMVRHDPVRAESALQDMADLFRVLMRENRDLTPLSEEIEICRQYLDLEKLRLGSRLIVDWHINNMPKDALVPPLVLQPLLENAIHHGIESSPKTGKIFINIFLSRLEVHAILRNPYRAGNDRHHRGNRIAVANVRARLALHFDTEASLSAKIINSETYETHIRMPYRPQPKNRKPPLDKKRHNKDKS